MILIERGQENVVVLTLTEKCTMINPVFLFEFRNDSHSPAVYFIAQDVSEFPERYNKFLITEKEEPNLFNGEVELRLEGFYHYTIHELINPTLDPEASVTVLEKGKVKVTGTETPRVEPTYSPEENIVYNG